MAESEPHEAGRRDAPAAGVILVAFEKLFGAVRANGADSVEALDESMEKAAVQLT